MTRENLIAKWNDLLYYYGEYDVWDDDIEPSLDEMSTAEIKRRYENDKDYYLDREESMMAQGLI